MNNIESFVYFIIFTHYIKATVGMTFESHGCYLNVISNASMSNETIMSGEICSSFCFCLGFKIAALSNVINGVMFITGDYDIEAHCSCSAVEPAIKVNNSLCRMPCPKNTEQKCGGYNSSIFNVYKMSQGYKGQSSGSNNDVVNFVIAAVISSLLVICLFSLVLFLYLRFKSRKMGKETEMETKNSKKEPDTLSRPQNQYMDTIYHDDNSCGDDNYEPMEDPKYYYIDESLKQINREDRFAEYRLYDTVEECRGFTGNNSNYYNTKELQQQQYEVPRTNSKEHLYLKLNENS